MFALQPPLNFAKNWCNLKLLVKKDDLTHRNHVLYLRRATKLQHRNIKILQDNVFFHVVLKARRILFLALWETLENEETLQAKILSWYIEIYDKSSISEMFCYCAVTHKTVHSEQEQIATLQT